MIQEKKSIIHGIVTKLRSNIADMNILQGFMRLQVPYLNHKRMGSVALAVDDKLRHYHGVICGTSERANPPL